LSPDIVNVPGPAMTAFASRFLDLALVTLLFTALT
jgi:hypothetical protein